LISILVHCRPGDELIVGDKAHIVLYEGGGVSGVGGVIPRTLTVQPDGTLKISVEKRRLFFEVTIVGHQSRYPSRRSSFPKNKDDCC
jgi:threonine aldolase